MGILMLSANTGEGHNATARAIMEVYESRQIPCQLEDCLAFLSPGFSKFISNWHVRLYRHGPKLFDWGYRFAEFTSDPDEFNPIYELLSLGAKKLRDWILERDFDAIICSHSFAGAMVTEIRRSWGLDIPCYFVATDYTCHPVVEQCQLDGYFIPTADQKGEFEAAGIPEALLFPVGIPVRQAFYRKTPKEEVREKLGLDRESVYVLLMCGSMGCGPIEKTARDLVEKLPENARVIAVCGSNAALLESMEKIQNPRLTALGFTPNMDEYMDAVDLMITKPGGLSSTEGANKGLPMVFFNLIGACESRNFNYFLSKEYALGSTAEAEVVDLAVALARDTQRREKMSAALRENFCINSTEEIVSHVTAQVENQWKKALAGAL